MQEKKIMNERYSRNRIYVSQSEQESIKDFRILLGGAGIGSIIAECALRFGFENITIVDGDRVEESNLNRQNYITEDIGNYKAESLAKRLLQINPQAKIQFHNSFIENGNVEQFIVGHDIAVNALDFKSNIPFVFDEICRMNNIPVLHPYNFGWAGFLTIVKPDRVQLTELSDEPQGFELKIAEYVARSGTFWNEPTEWLNKIIEQYKNEKNILPPPQLSIGSWIAAGHCVNAIYNLATGKEVKFFPKFYLSSIYCDNN